MTHKLERYFQEKDPGFFQLKHSFKTLLAILMALGLLYTYGLYPMVLAGLVAGFSGQGVEGDTRAKQALFILIVGGIYFLCYLAGYYAKASPIAADLLLIILAFMALYVRRFGSRFTLAPIFAWNFAFFAIILNPPAAANPYEMNLAFIVGVLSTAIVHLSVFPENKTQLFYRNLKNFFSEYANALQWLLSILLQRIELENYERLVADYKEHLHRIILTNSKIINTDNFSHSSGQAILAQIYLRQYALLKLIGMIMEGFQALIRRKIRIPTPVRAQLFALLAAYAAILANINIRSVDQAIEISGILKVLKKQQDEFKHCLTHYINEETQTVTPLLTIQLGFRLIYHNLELLEQSIHDQA